MTDIPHATNVVSFVEFKAKRKAGYWAASHRHQFGRDAPLIRGLGLSGWHDATLTVLDAEYCGFREKQPDGQYFPWSVKASIEAGGSSFTIAMPVNYADQFCWPAINKPTPVAALFTRRKFNDTKACVLVELMNPDLVAIAA